MENFKTLSNISKKYTHTCDDDKIIVNQIDNGKLIPLPYGTKAKDLHCKTCKGNRGYYNAYWKAWGCGNPDCIPKNRIYETGKEKYKEIPSGFHVIEKPKKMLDDCKQDVEKLAYFNSYVINLKGFLVLAGDNGTGKSYAAKAILYDSSLPNDEKLFITQSDLNFKWLKDLEQWNSSLHLLEKMHEYKLIVIDDLGTRTPTEAFMDFIYNIVNHRFENKKATIITTNMDALEMREKFGEAFTSRVASGKCFRFKGADRRSVGF